MALRVAILGATGSVGSQALQILKNHTEQFEVVLISAHSNREKLDKLISDFTPKAVILTSENPIFKSEYSHVLYFEGLEDFDQLILDYKIDLVLNALPSIFGLTVSIKTLEAGVDLILANKESLMLKADALNELAKRNNAEIISVDSEISAVNQCLNGYNLKDVRKVFITASGGPLLNKNIKGIDVTKEMILNHPVWNMGPKISVDSATMINKAFEVWEVHKLLKIPLEKIDVLLDPRAEVHAIVNYKNGDAISWVGPPTMEDPLRLGFGLPPKNQRISDEVNSENFIKLEPGKYPMFDLSLCMFKSNPMAVPELLKLNDKLVYQFIQNEISYKKLVAIFLSEANKLKKEKVHTKST